MAKNNWNEYRSYHESTRSHIYETPKGPDELQHEIKELKFQLDNVMRFLALSGITVNAGWAKDGEAT